MESFKAVVPFRASAREAYKNFLEGFQRFGFQQTEKEKAAMDKACELLDQAFALRREVPMLRAIRDVYAKKKDVEPMQQILSELMTEVAEYVPKTGKTDFIQTSFNGALIEHAQKIISGETDMPEDTDEEGEQLTEGGEPEDEEPADEGDL